MTRPTFMGFEMSKSAIFANQKSLDIVGNNLSNSNTVGYTRQRTERESVITSTLNRVMVSNIGLAGQGVETTGITQVRDEFLDKRFRDEYATSSYHAQASNILSDVQAAMGDGQDITDETGLYGGLMRVYEALYDYIKEPTMQTEANIVQTAFENMAQVLHHMDAKLTNVSEQHIFDLGVSVGRVNEIAQQIAYINDQIASDAAVLTDPDNEHFGPNELLDQRNVLLDELASYGEISVTPRADGQVDVQFGKEPLIIGDDYDVLNLQVNSDQTVSVRLSTTGDIITTSDGILRASMDYLNGRGPNAQSENETLQQGIPYYRDQLDAFAAALAEVANTAIPEIDTTDPNNTKPLVDANGNIVYKTLLGAKGPDGTTNGNLPITASNLAISTEWLEEGPGYFIYDENTATEDYAQKLAYNLTEGTFTFTAYGQKYTGTFADFEINFVGDLAAEINFQSGRQSSTAAIADDLLDQRDSVSGVSQDEETADMLKYQKSYEAAARLMTALDELLDVIINQTGMVGR